MNGWSTTLKRRLLGTIGVKIGMLFTLVIGAISAFIFFFFPARIAIQAENALDGKAQSIAAIVAFSVRSAMVFDDREAMKETLRAAMQNEDLLFISVADSTGTIISFLSTPAAEARPEVAHTPDGESSVTDVRRRSIPVQFNGSDIGMIYVGISLDHVRLEVQRARIVAAFVSVIIFLLGMAAILGFSRFLTVRLRTMVRTAERIAEGDLTERAQVASFDEIGQLAGAFNVMVGRLQLSNEELELANRALESRVEDRTRDLRLESTVRKRVEEELRQSQKMDAVGRLAAGVAHDFNNLLTVINGHGSLLLDDIPESDACRSSLERIVSAGESAASLTRQLLAFSRKQVLKPKVLDLNAAVQNVGRMLDRLLGEEIEVVLNLSPSVGLVKVDPGQVEQVIMNLAVNARDAMPDGGKLRLRTEDFVVDPAFAEDKPGLSPGAYVRLGISDTGAGIPPELLDKVFEPFFTTKKSGRGTGLGLSTVYGIVKQSHGYIWVDSDQGTGTTIAILFPHTSERSTSTSKPLLKGPRRRAHETILVVEDSDPVREIACNILADAGYKIIAANGGDEALAICRDYGDHIDLLLTDVVMPGMHGGEVAEKVKRIHPETRLLYMTGYTDDAIVHRGVIEAGVELIEKPFTASRLLSHVRNILQPFEEAPVQADHS